MVNIMGVAEPTWCQRLRQGMPPWGAANVPTGSMLSRLYIAQMDCPTEGALIRKKLGGMAELQGLEFNLMRRVLTVAHRVEALPAVEDAIRELDMNTSRPSDVADTAPDVQPIGKPRWPLRWSSRPMPSHPST